MRIGVNTLSVVPGRTGGGERYLASLLGAMVKARRPDEKLVLYATRENELLFPPAGPGVEVARLPVPPGRRSLRLLVEHLLLPALLAARPVDVLLSPGNALPPFAGVRHVLALQSMHYRFVPDQMAAARVRYFRTMVPLSARRAARVICVSDDLRRALREVAPGVAAEVIHEGVDHSIFAPGGPAAPGPPYLLTVSSLDRYKRPDRVVEALARLREGGLEPPILRLVGRADPVDRARVEARAGDLGVADLIRIEGVVGPTVLAALYRGARALVYPSAVETFGLPPLEAMACGCPVVASNRTSLPEVCGDGALLVDPDDASALTEAVRRILTEDGLREDLVARGFANVGRFSWARAAEATLEVLRAAGRT